MNFQALTASIRHELKQPLTAISANSSAGMLLLEGSPPDVEEARASLNDIKNDARRAGEVLDSIGALFTNEAKARQPIDINDVIIEVLNALRRELKDAGVTAQTELTAGLPFVRGHKGQLREVIYNLANNAIEAMQTTTTVKRRLRVRTESRGDDAIVVTVEDTGPGLDPKKIDGIFDACVTTKARGMGLGLAICRMIIERHGGQLSASSDGKSGALFQFVLPVGSADKTVTMAPSVGSENAS